MDEQTKKLRKQITGTIAVLSFIVIIFSGIILALNYFQLKMNNPAESKIIEKLNERLAKSPDDIQLREEIRTLDLISRKAFFTSQWQLNTGAYVLLFAFVIFLISGRIYLSLNNKFVLLPPEKNKPFLYIITNERKWIMYSTGLFTLFCLVLMFLSKTEYKDFSVLAQQMNKQDSVDVKQISLNKKDTLKVTDTMPAVKDTVAVSDTAKVDEFPTDQQIMSNHPAFRGPFGLGVSYAKNIPTDWDGVSKRNVIWKVTPPLPGTNSPVIWGNYLFISGANASSREVYCYNRGSGKLIWKGVVDKIEGSPAAPLKTNDETGWAAASVTTDGKMVYAIFATGDLIAFDMEGKRVWAKNVGVPNNHYGHSSSLLLYQNILIVQYDQNKTRNLIGYNALTGEVVWNTARSGKISWSSPILVRTGKSTQVVVNNDPYVAGYDPLTGKEIWKIEALYGEIGSSPAYGSGLVFSTNAYAKMVAIQPVSQAKVVWENQDYLPDVSSPVAYKDMVFVSTAAGEVACYSAKDGKELWYHEFDAGFYASPMVADGNVFLLDRNGTMHIIKADKEFQLVSEPALGEKADCTPAFSSGKIYIRTAKNLYCIGAPK